MKTNESLRAFVFGFWFVFFFSFFWLVGRRTLALLTLVFEYMKYVSLSIIYIINAIRFL